MKYSKYTFKPYGKTGILVEWEPKIEEDLLLYILSVKKTIHEKYHKVIVEIIHTYNSLLIIYNKPIKNIYDKILELNPLFTIDEISHDRKVKRFYLPVCYDEKFGLDTEFIATKKKLTPEEIIARHSSQIYTLYFMGFLPGFLYLGTVEKSLHISRRNQPRKRVKKGAVGIAGNQTGIYPKSAPGGWQIIGNCPMDFFRPNQDPPSIFSPADQIQFYPISLVEHQDISERVKAGKFQPKIEIYGN